jgi:osmotically-inducible protein OsmY
MKILLTLVVGIVIGAAVVWCCLTREGKATVRSTGEHIGSAAHSANDAVQENLRVLGLRSEDIKEELARTGQVIRRSATAAGRAIADSTASARMTTGIKARLVGASDLSALNISVNTTEGVVTLSGTVRSPEDIGKAMLLAMETEGVREVVSTLQVKPNH